ncbi:Fanconi anemia group J protein homolog [Glandiceps talaboti]
MASPGIERSIGGVKVQFPCRPYPSQFSMMNKIIQGLQRQQNCLLESPTGSGKSLALLCSCLAWQKNEYEKQLQQLLVSDSCDVNNTNETTFKAKDCQCCCHQPICCVQEVQSTPMASKYFQNDPQQTDVNTSTSAQGEKGTLPVQHNDNSNNNSVSGLAESSQDDDFKPALKKFRTKGSKKGKVTKGVVYLDDSDVEELPSSPPKWKMEITNASAVLAGLPSQVNASTHSETTTAQNVCTCQCALLKSMTENPESENIPKVKVPRIFFGTRTHKQIAQIIRELRRTAYSNVRMAILASREHYCVHPHVSRSSNKNEGCKQLLDNKNDDTCSYYQHAHKLKTQDQLRFRQGFDTAWDVEDLVTLGKKIRVCPYFAVRGLMDDADIVFCPYNYLIDPKIRSAMEISLKNQIVVLDEAHNIEDSSRDAASLSLKQDDIEEAMDELDKMIALRVKVDDMRAMREMCVSFVRWINNMSDTLQQSGFEKSSRVWAGVDFVAVLDSMAITPLTIPLLKQSYSNIMADNFDPTKPEQPSLSSQTASLLEGIFIVLRYLFKDNMKFMNDYRIAIEKTISTKSYSAFNDVSSCTRSIILTSGTLSPMASFSSELGAQFPIQLEANHVIHNSQVWVGTIATGPSGGILNATYKFAETFSFQDEMGQLVLGVCRSIPHGVLCFLPSYNMMDKLCNRWKITGLWEQLEQRKMVITEPRRGDKADFDDLLKQFYEAIRETGDSDTEDDVSTGALFLAVCRGKVSEGLDFADNNARAVITVGIPFPNIKDTVVDLKKRYNNEHVSSRGLLSGNDWYEIQAYRALNQALGRCIRHRQDWGALILVDERFGKNPTRYIKGLSKWVRHQVKHYYRCNDAMSSLTSFANARLKDPCPDISTMFTSQCIGFTK